MEREKLNELQHYGVLGMKWGVRKYQDRKGRLTPLGKRLIEERSALDQTSEFARNGGVLPAGSTLYRATTSVRAQYGMAKGAPISEATYASLVPSENSRYVMELRSGIDDALYKLTTTKDLKIPSVAESREIFASLSNRKGFDKAFMDSGYTQETLDTLKDTDKSKYSNEVYSTWASSMYARSSTPMNSFFKEELPKALEERGYNAIIDYFSNVGNTRVYKNKTKPAGDLVVFDKNALEISGKEHLNVKLLRASFEEVRNISTSMHYAQDFLKSQGFKVD